MVWDVVIGPCSLLRLVDGKAFVVVACNVHHVAIGKASRKPATGIATEFGHPSQLGDQCTGCHLMVLFGGQALVARYDNRACNAAGLDARTLGVGWTEVLGDDGLHFPVSTFRCVCFSERCSCRDTCCLCANGLCFGRYYDHMRS